MDNHCDNNLYKEWDERWEGSEETERLTWLGRLMFKAKIRAISRLLKEVDVKSVIEVGCGLGYTLKVFHDTGYDAIGIDVSTHAIAVCKKKGLTVKPQKLEDVTEQYDLVSSDGMLEHFLNFEPYAKHMMRISRRYVMLIQPNHDSFTGKSIAFAAELLKGDVNVFEYNYRIKDFIAVFQKHNFDIIHNSPIFFNIFRLLLFERNGPVKD